MGREDCPQWNPGEACSGSKRKILSAGQELGVVLTTQLQFLKENKERSKAVGVPVGTLRSMPLPKGRFPED